MKNDGMDIFDEMDQMFDRLFDRMSRNMNAGMAPSYEYRIVFRNGGDLAEDSAPVPEIPVLPATEPVPEVHRIGDEIKVIAELPGAVPESIRPEIRNSTLVIDADNGTQQFHTFAEIPPVDAGSMETSFRNGVLEVTLKALPAPAADET